MVLIIRSNAKTNFEVKIPKMQESKECLNCGSN